MYNEKINLNPFFPDKLVYCGINIVNLEKNEEKDLFYIKNYIEKYDEIPKLFTLESEIYINSISLRKCVEIESLFKSHLISYNENNIFLSNEENNYLNNWDSEKYRQK
jgi:hypothetical protein